MPQMTSFLGLAGMFLIAWIFSENRRAAQWRLALIGTSLQFVLALLVLKTEAGRFFFSIVKSGFDVLTDASSAGAEFVFGNLAHFFFIQNAMVPGADGTLVRQELFPVSAVVAFNVLPVIIFVAALSAILQYYGVVQAVVRALSWLMRRTLKTSGAETFGTALLVFTGIESAAALGDYVRRMTRSEIFTIEVAFLATIAASVMVAYAGFGAEPGHLLAASLMSAPAAIAVAKIMVPETGTPETSAAGCRFELAVESTNVFDAASRGASLGLGMALHVGAMLIAFVGLIYVADLAVAALAGVKLNVLLGYAFRPLAWMMGVPWSDIPLVAELLATKTVFNEFLAYQNMQPMIEKGLLAERSVTIATYALCGFANPGSLGIMIGGLSSLAPERRGEIAQLSIRALIGGTLASFMTACIAGILL